MSASASPPTGPSATVRSLISAAIVIHLVFLGVAVLSNGSAADLSRRLRRLAGPYLQLTFQDLNYRFHHTAGSIEDAGWRLSAQATLPNGEPWQWQLADQAEGLPIRQQRYFRLARQLGSLSGELTQEEQSVLARGLAVGLTEELRTQGIDPAKVRNLAMTLRIRYLPEPEQLAQQFDPESPRWFETIYEADIVLLPTGQLLVNRRTAAGEAAPAARGSAPAATTPPAADES